MASEGWAGRAGTGATAAGAGAGTEGVGMGERTIGRVTGNSVSVLRRRGFAAGTMGAVGSKGIWSLWKGSVAAKPRSAPWRAATGW